MSLFTKGGLSAFVIFRGQKRKLTVAQNGKKMNHQMKQEQENDKSNLN